MLIVCPECKHSVSDQAAACPSCGAPIRPVQLGTVRVARAGGSWQLLGLLAMVVGFFWGVMAGSTGSYTSATIAGVFAFCGLVAYLIGRFM